MNKENNLTTNLEILYFQLQTPKLLNSDLNIGFSMQNYITYFQLETLKNKTTNKQSGSWFWYLGVPQRNASDHSPQRNAHRATVAQLPENPTFEAPQNHTKYSFEKSHIEHKLQTEHCQLDENQQSIAQRDH